MITQQQIRLDIKQIKPEAINLFYESLLKQIVIAKDDSELYREYLKLKKGSEKKISIQIDDARLEQSAMKEKNLGIKNEPAATGSKV